MHCDSAYDLLPAPDEKPCLPLHRAPGVVCPMAQPPTFFQVTEFIGLAWSEMREITTLNHTPAAFLRFCPLDLAGTGHRSGSLL